MNKSFGRLLQQTIDSREITTFIGVYDVFSASIAAKYYDGIFVSGFSFAASHYGLPDIGFIAWPDIVSFVQRIRTVLPKHHLLVDIDDGYCDPEVACHVVSLLESAGASAVIIEDQKRPRKCGHFSDKQLMDLDEFVEKLKSVIATRKEMLVVARTDSSDTDEISRRTAAFSEAGADVILVDGLKDIEILRRLKDQLGKHIMFNQIAGGKSPPCSLSQLSAAGVTLVNYSTPCLFAAQQAVEQAMQSLKEKDGLVGVNSGPDVGVQECTQILHENLQRRDQK